jgi:NitT/TauT family transport system substrate-binding protein
LSFEVASPSQLLKSKQQSTKLKEQSTKNKNQRPKTQDQKTKKNLENHMLRSPLIRWIVGIVAFVAILGLVRYKPWQHRSLREMSGSVSKTAPQELKVGYLPVTCHLTCPVTDFATRTSTTNRFESQRFTDFPTVVESVKSGRLDATFMIAPLAMKLREQGVPVKIVYLGHRDGSTVIVRKDLPAQNLADLRGKTFAIPSKYSNQYLVIRKLMDDQGVKPDEIRFVELPPPDMPGALAAKAIDAYFVGEPHAAKAELDGSGRVLYHAKDIWPHFISCVLVVTEKLIRERPEVVRDLVRGIAESGEWAEVHRLEAAKVVAPYFRQDEKVIRYVLTQPPNRVSYRMLTPTDADLQQINDMAVKAGILERPIAMKDLIDRQFIPLDIKPANIDGGE